MLQQENKTDYNSLIGFALIGVVLFWLFNEQAKVEEVMLQNSTEKIDTLDQYSIDDVNFKEFGFDSKNEFLYWRKQDLNGNVEHDKKVLLAKQVDYYPSKFQNTKNSNILSPDTANLIYLQELYGAFSNAARKEDIAEKFYLENDLIKVEVAAKGARVTSVYLKEYQTHDSLPLNLLREDSSRFNFTFWAQNRRLQTSDFVFVASQTQLGGKQQLSMRMNVSEGKYLEFSYALAPNSYKVEYALNLVGLDGLIESNTPIEMDWSAAIPSQELSRYNEAMNTSAYYYTDSEVDYLSSTSNDSERVLDTEWVAFKSQYFSTVLQTEALSKEISLSTTDLPDSDRFLKTLNATANLNYEGGTHSYSMDWYFVPNHVKTLKSYGIGLEELVPLGWSIIGWINKYVVINIFNTFEAWGWGYGLIIFMMALLIKIALFPFTYKSYSSMAKMRVLKPQVDAINEKYEDQMKRQQEMMALYQQTGVNPLGGCIPMLFQMPILFALFRFFPASIELRQQGFLWATDLSTYDSILDLGFNIPFYGDHVSLFTLLMTATTVLQMKYSNSMSGSNAQMPQMKYMMYFMPIIFLGVMNSYAAALSYYYFLANLITFGQQKLIGSMIDDSVLLAKMEEKKQNAPAKGKSKFQARLEKMMKEQQEAQKRK